MEKYLFTGPYNGEKEVKVSKKQIARVFNQPILLGGSGKAKLRKGSQTGQVIEEFDIDSGNVFASGRELVVVPQKLLPYETEIFLTLDDGFVISKLSGEKCNFLNENSNITFSFTTEDPIGKPLEGGTIISKFGGKYLIVSPNKTEMNLFWEEYDKVIAYTEKITKTSGWMVPSLNIFLDKNLDNKDLWFLEKPDNNLFWTSDTNGDEVYCIDLKDMIVKSINKNTSNTFRTFKFVDI